MARVLVVDDERSMQELLQILLESEGYEVHIAGTVQEAMKLAGGEPPDLVLSDLQLPDGSGLDLLRWMHQHQPECQVIMMTAYGSTETAVEAMKMGAYDYQIKPVKVDEIRAVVAKALEKVSLIRENRQLSARLRERARFVRNSPAMLKVLDLIEKVASTRTNVLIEGESGTGKELVARAIHGGSTRSKGPFIAVNCGAIPETLIEAELFGHAAGAFTGATKARAGLFEAADGGTLLLDEIGELPQAMQVKLLRALQERKVRRVGEDSERSIDVRIVAATNRDLQKEVAAGTFREDLFYRLNVVRIRVPPLRERPEDISELVQIFIERFSRELGKNIVGISANALNLLLAFPFPGNVRELENYMERAVALVGSDTIDVEDLPEGLRESKGLASRDPLAFPESGIALEERLNAIETQLIHEALHRTNGVKTQAASLLGLTFRSFRYRLKKLGIESDDARDESSADM